MTNPEISLSWSAIFKVAPRSKIKLPGDKIRLPQSALEQLLAASTTAVTSSSRPVNTSFDPFNPYSLAAARVEQSGWRGTEKQLPHPLTFRLVNPKNGNVVHAGIREFSAEEGEVELSPFLLEALGLEQQKARSKPTPTRLNGGDFPPDVIDLTRDNSNPAPEPIDFTEIDDEEVAQVTIHAKQLPKGTYVRLRPLEAGYNPEDWKALLEKHMRENYTTLTQGEILTVAGSSKSEEFRFLIDKFKPEGDGICVVDTDLEVDIEALNEEQARETLKRILAKAQKAPGTAEGSSVGGDLNIWKPSTGQILDGDYVDYRLPSWDRTQVVNIELTTEDGEELQLFVSPFSSRQRVAPRADEHIFGDFSNDNSKSVIIQPSNIEMENADELRISVHAFSVSSAVLPAQTGAHKYSLQVQLRPKGSLAGSSNNPIAVNEDTEMHGPDEEQCKNCQKWILKRTMMLHENFCLRNNILCPRCLGVFQKKSQEWEAHWHCPHDSAYGNSLSSKEKHDEISHKPRLCPNCPYKATNLRDLAIHRTSVCRTTECHLCSKIIRLREMATHLKHHELEKAARSKPTICRNSNCGRTLHGVGKNGEIGGGSRIGQGPGNDLGICSICFGPLYVSQHDPEGKALKRRVERRYLGQMIKGCGNKWCSNEYCKTAMTNSGKGNTFISAQEALPLVKPLMAKYEDRSAPMYFCVDESSQKRRKLAEMLAVESDYDLEWCIAACEAETGKLDSARKWLENWAPKK
ncbi:hypothetical protein BGZ60DRAFT_540206 [Tricladium varicosporioides]|nr:hypothetical protein BGZ60DRAFT_540206 [Hymenoscyphus varicosporioides]